MAWTCDISIEEKVRQDCYNRGYEAGRKNPCDEIVAHIEELQKQVKEYRDKIEQGTLIELIYPMYKSVYFLRNKAVEEGVIVSFKYNRYTNPKMWYTIEYHIPELKSHYVEEVREDMIYSTREEAENKLKELQEC